MGTVNSGNAAKQGSGTRDTRVDRPEEGLPGLATVENPTANPPTRGTFDAGRAGGSKLGAVAQIDTSSSDGGGGITPGQIERAKPSVF